MLTVTQMLRKKGVVGKFVEFFGPGLGSLTLADRATIANMAPEYGATCGFFPVDAETLDFLKTSGRRRRRVALVETYAKAQGMFRTRATPDPVFTDTLELDLATVQPSIAGPKRPQDRVAADRSQARLRRMPRGRVQEGRRRSGQALQGRGQELRPRPRRRRHRRDHLLHQHVEPRRDDRGGPAGPQRGGAGASPSKPWVKTSLAPGSQVVAEYLAKAGLQKSLDKLGFNLVGFGCTTCIGNSGPLPAEVSKSINDNDLVAAAVLSGNRNFEGRVNPDVRANYLASPPLVVAYALAGSLQVDLTKEPLGTDKKGKPVYLKDIWPTSKEIEETIRRTVTKSLFKSKYADVFKGDAQLAEDQGRGRPDLYAGTTRPPMSRTRPTSTA